MEKGRVSHQLWDQADCNLCKDAGSLKSDPRIKNCPDSSQSPLNDTNLNGMCQLHCHTLQKPEPRIEVNTSNNIINLFD